MEHELAQELARTSLAIQDARREFDTLKAEKDAWLVSREQEALQRVTDALENARNMVEETVEYAKVIEQLRQGAESMKTQIVEARMSLQEQRRQLDEQTKETRKSIDAKVAETAKFLDQAKIERVHLNGLLDSVKLERESLTIEQERITKDRQMLGVAIKELKKRGLWQKQLETTIVSQ